MPANPDSLSADTDESSLRYAGWRVVGACFIVAIFSWGFGLYGHGVYLVELQRRHGWPATLISGAASAYYLLSATLVVFIGDAMARLGPRRVMLSGACCIGSAVVLLGVVAAPWQLYAIYLVLAVGVTTLHTGAITTVVGLWFDRRRGLAVSLALTGASFGGVLVTPALVLAIEHVGFQLAMAGAAAIMALAVLPIITAWIDRPSQCIEATPACARDRTSVGWTRPIALRSLRFWSVAGPFAIALMAQIGFLVHQVAFLEPAIGRMQAGLAVGIMSIMSIAGRLALGIFSLRLDVRLMTAASTLSQAAALFAMLWTTNVAALFCACAVFGLSIGNLITLPAMVVQREFEAPSFGVLIGLSTAIGQFSCVFGPGLLGLIRDATGGYAAALGFCIALEILAAAAILVRPISTDPPISDNDAPR